MHLKTFYEKDVLPNRNTPLDGIEYIDRLTGRVVAFDQEGNIALIGTTRHGFFLLPGGGIEEAESIEEGILRECREEIGCDVAIRTYIGKIDDYRPARNRHVITHCYVVDVVGEKGELQLTEDEIEVGHFVVWRLPSEAIQILKQQVELLTTTEVDFYQTAFCIMRDYEFLQRCISINQTISIHSVRDKLASYSNIQESETDKEIYFEEYNSDKATLFYLGVHHSYDPNNLIFTEIKTKFDTFLSMTEGKNRCVVIEGGLRGVAIDKDSSIINEGGEGGYLMHLAAEAGIKAVCYEPNQKSMIDDASKIYGQDLVFYSFMCDRVYQYSQETDKPDFASYVGYFIKEFNDLIKATYSLEMFFETHQRISGKQFDSNDSSLFYSLSDPTNEKNPIREVASFIAEYRDAYITDQIIKNHMAGISQFVLYGKTHAIIQKPALKYFLK